MNLIIIILGILIQQYLDLFKLIMYGLRNYLVDLIMALN